jgi:SnoaL-like domain
MNVRADTRAFDLTAFVAAIESRDAEGQIAAFSDDAELTVIDHEHPPSNPLVLCGTKALQTYFADICGRDMTHEVTTATATDDSLILDVACRYADGTRVACLSVSRLTDGLITAQRGLQAWDH